MSAYDNGLGPARHKTRNGGYHDGFSENCATTDISDSSVGRFPHLLEVELSHASLVRGYSCALYSNFACLNGFGSLNRHLIVCGITVLHAEVEILDIEVQVRENELFLNELPNDSGHLVTIHLHYGICNNNLLGCLGHLFFVRG